MISDSTHCILFHQVFRHFIKIEKYSVLLNLYRSFIQAFLSNGVAVCGQVARSNLENVLILQKRALRIISFKPFKFHAVPFVNLSNILPRHLIYFKTIFSFMHDFFNDLAPPKFQNYLFIL